jgi:hypothetical protein
MIHPDCRWLEVTQCLQVAVLTDGGARWYPSSVAAVLRSAALDDAAA